MWQGLSDNARHVIGCQREKQRDASACIRSHQAFALAPVGCQSTQETRV